MAAWLPVCAGLPASGVIQEGCSDGSPGSQQATAVPQGGCQSRRGPLNFHCHLSRSPKLTHPNQHPNYLPKLSIQNALKITVRITVEITVGARRITVEITVKITVEITVKIRVEITVEITVKITV